MFCGGLYFPDARLSTSLFAARQAKQRPLTDPLIVHVPDTASALAVVDFEVQGGGGEKARRLLDLLGAKLWPGEGGKRWQGGAGATSVKVVLETATLLVHIQRNSGYPGVF